MPERIRGNGFTDPDDRHVRGGSWSVRFAGPYRRSQYTRRTEPDRTFRAPQGEPDIVMSVNGPRKEVRKAIGDARRTEGVAYADAGPGEVTPYGGNGGVLPVVDIPVDGGDRSRTGLEESVGNAVVAYPERTRNRATVIDGSGGDGTPETVR